MTPRPRALPDLPPAITVLVADADAEARQLYQQTFAPPAYRVIEATNGREALVKGLVERPTLVVTELRLPLLDGVSLCETLRRDAATAHVPILVVTEQTAAPLLERVRRLDATVLSKPASPDDLRREAERLRPRVHDDASPRCEGPLSANLDSAEIRPRKGTSAANNLRRTVTTPPRPVPPLKCPRCDAALRYTHTYIGGVNPKRIEQWDALTCPGCATSFEYRHRTRKLRQAM